MFEATIPALEGLPVKRIYDNGTENVKHEEVNNVLNCKSFLTDLTAIARNDR